IAAVIDRRYSPVSCLRNSPHNWGQGLLLQAFPSLATALTYLSNLGPTGSRRTRGPGRVTNVAKHPGGSSPPKLGGVARRRFISRAGVVQEENIFKAIETRRSGRGCEDCAHREAFRSAGRAFAFIRVQKRRNHQAQTATIQGDSRM